MVAYSFQAQFVEPIRIGLTPGPLRPGGKRHTIRAHGKRRHARPGETLQLYRGMRTQQCFKIGEALCTEVLSIRLIFAKDTRRDSAVIGTRGRQELNAFAVSDGFYDWAELRAFWGEYHPGVVDFDGILIEWKP